MTKRKSTARQPKRKFRKFGLIGWAIIFLTVFILVFVLSMLLTPSEVTVMQKAPAIIRVQLLNGCGAKGAVDEVAKELMALQGSCTFDIVDRSNADVFVFDHTMVLDRRGNSETVGYSDFATTVAHLLDVGPENLVVQRLADNLLDIDVTVIVGADYKTIIENIRKGKTTVDS